MKGLLMNKILIFIMISFLSFVGILKADGHKPDIVDTAVAAGSFNTLVKAVTAADLVETLKSKGPFTVFAPSDDAFSALDPNLLADLLKSENKDKLTGILTFHVLAGKVMSSDISGTIEATTVNGQKVTVKKSYGNVFVNDAQVVAADIEADNGVIHVINKVLIPE
tara:strand:- start:392 stop:889 length:498 start_codon:yes stop_codon:yes gene_type:complete